MLTRLRINNFKSLLNFEFKPVGMDLIIGSNNAGKTNLCSALRFFGLTSERPLDTAILSSIGERWNLTNYNVENNAIIELEMDCRITYEGQDIFFNYLLRLQTRKGNAGEAQSVTVEEESLTASGGRFAQTPLLKNRLGQVSMLHEEGFVDNRANSPYYVEAHVSRDSTLLAQLYELETNKRAIRFRHFLRSWSYYNFSPDALRQPDVVRNDDILLSSGANLSRVLFALHNEKPRIERKLIEAVQLLEPHLDLFSFSSPDPEHVHLFAEDKAGHRLSTRSLSDGTLRFIGMVYAILIAEYRTQQMSFSPLTVIEEPENGLYAGHIKPLVEQIDPSGRKGQFIFTSHSPYFIDLFDNNIDAIHLVKSGHPSSILVKPDSNKVKKLLNEMSLGELHFREILA